MLYWYNATKKEGTVTIHIYLLFTIVLPCIKKKKVYLSQQGAICKNTSEHPLRQKGLKFLQGTFAEPYTALSHPLTLLYLMVCSSINLERFPLLHASNWPMLMWRPLIHPHSCLIHSLACLSHTAQNSWSKIEIDTQIII